MFVKIRYDKKEIKNIIQIKAIIDAVSRSDVVYRAHTVQLGRVKRLSSQLEARLSTDSSLLHHFQDKRVVAAEANIHHNTDEVKCIRTRPNRSSKSDAASTIHEQERVVLQEITPPSQGDALETTHMHKVQVSVSELTRKWSIPTKESKEGQLMNVQPLMQKKTIRTYFQYRYPLIILVLK